MAVWQRDLPQEWEVRPAPDKSGARWRKKGGEFLSKVELWVKEERERRRRRGELPLRGQSFSRKIWEEIDCQNDLFAFVSSLLF